ncbi:MAG: cytochrome c-type biogenesis CcmF C-terminal domain-containing protein [Pseudomonadota bacterium]
MAIWLILAAIVEWCDRIKLARAPFAESLRRMRNLPRAAHGMTLAHAGLGVAVLAMVGSSAFKSEEIVFAAPGTQVSVAGYDLTFEGTRQIEGPNYVADRAQVRVSRDGEPLTVLYPERRIYPVAGMPTTESAVRQTLAGDLYLSIAQPAAEDAQGRWILRVIYEPLINFLWVGSIMMVIGGCFSLSDRRLRIGAPRRSSAPTPSATPAE